MPTFYSGSLTSDADWLTADTNLLSVGEATLEARLGVIAQALEGQDAVLVKLSSSRQVQPKAPKAGTVDETEQQMIESLFSDHRDLIKQVLQDYAVKLKADDKSKVTATSGDKMFLQAAAFRKALIEAAPFDELVDGQSEPSIKSVARILHGMSLAASRTFYQIVVTSLMASARGPGRPAKTTSVGVTEDDQVALDELTKSVWISVLKDQYLGFCNDTLENQRPVAT